jgi:hypothetical protein
METTIIILLISLSSSLLWFSCWVFLYGIKIYLFLKRSTVSTNSFLYAERIKSTMRVLGVVVPCAVCYILRAFLVAILCIEYFTDKGYTDIWFSWLGWFMCSQWIPTLIPVSSKITETLINSNYSFTIFRRLLCFIFAVLFRKKV